MAASELDILRDKIYSNADAALRRRIDERLDPVRIQTQNVEFDVPAGRYTAAQLLNRLGDEVFKRRRDQNRAQWVDRFLQRVSPEDV